MGYDPNEWTRNFVTENKNFCVRVIKDTNDKVIHCLKQGDHKTAIAGLDRVLNGLITMINAGYDYRSQVSFFSWIEANIILFGNFEDAPEQNRIKTAKAALLDAKDFAKSDTTKNSINQILDDINIGYGLSVLTKKYAVDFPNSEIEILTGLNDKLDNGSAPVAVGHVGDSTNMGSTKKKPWLLAVAVIIVALIVISHVMTTGKRAESPAQMGTIQTTEATAQSTAIEATTETTDTDQPVLQNIVGDWEFLEITEGTLNPDGERLPDFLDIVWYTFDENGRYSVGDACYAEAREDEQSYAEEKDGRYWICIGGGGQEGNYTVNGNQITLITDDSVQYGPSKTTTLTFTLAGDTLVLESSYGAKTYRRTSAALNEY